MTHDLIELLAFKFNINKDIVRSKKEIKTYLEKLILRCLNVSEKLKVLDKDDIDAHVLRIEKIEIVNELKAFAWLTKQ